MQLMEGAGGIMDTEFVLSVDGVLSEPVQFNLQPEEVFFTDAALDFTLTVHVASFVDQYPVQHELRKRLLRRLRAEGVEIPVPARTIEIRSPRDA